MKRLAWAVVFVLLAALALAMCFYPMSWGLMDDGQALQTLRGPWTSLSLPEILRDYSSMNGGYFRPLYPLWVYFGYGTCINSPKTLYLINFAFVLAACYPWVRLLARQLLTADVSELTCLFALVLLMATPLYNHITYLSLQEKFVVFFAGYAYWLLDVLITTEAQQSPLQWWLAQLALVALALLGFWGKATFLAYMPGFVLAFLVASQIPAVRRWTTVSLWTLFSLAAGYHLLHGRGSYNSRYKTDFQGLLERLHNVPRAAYLFTALSIITFVILFRKRNAIGATFSGRLLWPLALGAYLAIMIPWGINTYYWGPAMVVAAGCLVILVEQVLMSLSTQADKLLPLMLLFGMLGASVIVFTTGIPRLARQAEIGKVARWLGDRLPNSGTAIFVQEPCYEATTNLAYYAGGKQSFTYLPVNQKADAKAPIWWLVTRDECVIAPSQTAVFDSIIFELPHWKIYQHSSTARPQ